MVHIHYINNHCSVSPQENNFKAVLESIRDLMNEDDVVVPDWLHDIFLGYGDPGAAQWINMPSEGRLTTVNFVVRFFCFGSLLLQILFRVL